jgi:hypothetical protein
VLIPKYHKAYQIKENIVGVGVTHIGENGKVYKVSRRSPEGKRPLKRQMCTCENGMNMDLGQIDC